MCWNEQNALLKAKCAGTNIFSLLRRESGEMLLTDALVHSLFECDNCHLESTAVQNC